MNNSDRKHITESTFICPLCGTAPVKDKSYHKHTKCRACKDLQLSNESAKSLNIKEVQLQAPSLVDEDRDTISHCIFMYTADKLRLLSQLSKQKELVDCDPLITAGRRYGYMMEYVSRRMLNVSFPLSIFLMDTPKETFNRPQCLMAIQSPSGSILDALKLLVMIRN